MAIIKDGLYYRVIYINECLSGEIEFMVRGFDSEETFAGAKASPQDGVNYIRYENTFLFPLSLYDQDQPLRKQVYQWLDENVISGGVVSNKDTVA
ncbi:hypothetical protein [Vibrio sp. JZG120]